MNKKMTVLMGMAVVASLLSPVAAANKKKAAAAPGAEMQAMMAKAKQAGTPGMQHAILKSFEGTWTTTSHMWMQPGTKPMDSTGTSTLSWVLGGRFLKQEFKGNVMGEAFEGLGYIGYDNVRAEYVSIWMDGMSTGIGKTAGQYDAVTKTIKSTGAMSCPVTGEKDMWFRDEWQIVDANTHIYSMFTKSPAGAEFKSMEITYKRAQ